jgi:hypothetical protein
VGAKFTGIGSSAYRCLAALAVGSCLAALPGCGGSHPPPAVTTTPNILFVIMDDVGIDQMQVFGYGGDTPPSPPTIDALAHAGVRFRNTWAMPPSRTDCLWHTCAATG